MPDDKIRKCPNGHAMDPSWNSCPYCMAQERSNQKNSMAEGGHKPTMILGQSGMTDASPKKTITDGIPQPSPGGRQTMVMPPENVAGPSKEYPPADTRKIVGVLVTYTWVPGGQLFPVREGKNYLGSGSAGAFSSSQGCDIQVPHDDRMSGVHALILCRSGKNEIIDQQSTNGTFLNGEMLMSNQSVELVGNAEIKTGSTSWTFVKIESPPVS